MSLQRNIAAAYDFFNGLLGIGGSLSPSGDGLLADLFLGRPRSRRYPKFNIRRDIPEAPAAIASEPRKQLSVREWPNQDTTETGDLLFCPAARICYPSITR